MRTWHRSCMKRTFGQSNARSGSRCLPVWHMEACRRRAFRSAYGGLLKKLVLFAIRKPVERCGARGLAEKCALFGVWDLSDLSESVLCSAYGSLSKHAFFAALAENAAKGPDCMNLGTCCQETPRWGLLSGRYSSDFFPENYVTWPFVELSCFVRAFAGFSLRNEVCREAPLSRFLPSGARGAARFSCDAFRRKVSSSRDWSCFEYHVFYGCEQQKRKHQIGG